MLNFQDNLHVHSLPPFANKRNKDLSHEINKKATSLSILEAALDDNVNRTETIKSHMKNVQQEFVHTQALCDAKNKQIETEDHFKQLAERQSGRLENDIKEMEKKVQVTQDELTTIQANLYKTTESIESLRAELKFSKQELEEWVRVQNEKEDDNAALLKYSKEDTNKIKQLSLTMEKLMSEVQKKKNALNAEVTETQVSQLELDKTTNEFKTLHQDRQQMIQQWENALQIINKRDEEVQETQMNYLDLKATLQKLQGVINEKQAFLNQQLEANEVAVKKMGLTDRTVSKYRLEHTEAIASLSQFQDEVDAIRNSLSKTATELISKRSDVTNLKSERQEKQNTLENERKNKSDAKTKLSQISDTTISMEQKALLLQNMLHQQELKSKELDRELKILRENQFKKNQELFKFKQDEKNLSAEITGAEASSKSLSSKIIKLDQEALKQQSLLYDQEFQIQQLERKVRRAQGDRTDEEKEILQEKIKHLNAELEEQNKKFSQLNVQLKKSQDDLRIARRKFDTLSKERDTITQSIDELDLYNDSAVNQLAVKIKEKEEFMVEENILRMELRKLRAFLNSSADQVYTLESKQLYLSLALEERTKEIQIHKEMLKVQIKNSDQENHSAAIELRDRVGKVEKLKTRYEILMSQFDPFGDEEEGDGSASGTEHTQAYYVIKAAQQREELQREGDELDAKIRKAEKEIKALENTLKLMNDRNEEYRMNIYKSELNSKDVQHHEMLSEQYENTMNHYKLKRDQLQDLQIDVTNLEKALQNVTMTENSKLQSIQILEVKLKALNKDITEQEAKKTRAINTMNKMMKSKFNGVDPDSNEELADIKVRELKDKCNILITEVAKVGEMYPEVEEKIDLIFKQSNIQLPSKPVSRAGSRNSFASVSSSNLSSRAGSRAEIRSQPVSAIHSRRPSDAVRQGSITPKNLSFNDVAASSEKVQRGSTSSKLASARSLTTSRRASLTSGSAKGSDMMIDAKEVSRRSSSRNESS